MQEILGEGENAKLSLSSLETPSGWSVNSKAFFANVTYFKYLPKDKILRNRTYKNR